MKLLIALLAVLVLSTPALAFDREAYKAAKQEWHSDWKETRSDWKAADKPDPKPTKPVKPSKGDF